MTGREGESSCEAPVSCHCLSPLGLGTGKSPSFGFLSSELGGTLSSLESQ